MKDCVRVAPDDCEGEVDGASVAEPAPLVDSVKLGETVGRVREDSKEAEGAVVRVGVGGTLSHTLAVCVRDAVEVGVGGLVEVGEGRAVERAEALPVPVPLTCRDALSGPLGVPAPLRLPTEDKEALREGGAVEV